MRPVFDFPPVRTPFGTLSGGARFDLAPPTLAVPHKGPDLAPSLGCQILTPVVREIANSFCLAQFVEPLEHPKALLRPAHLTHPTQTMDELVPGVNFQLSEAPTPNFRIVSTFRCRSGVESGNPLILTVYEHLA